MISAFGPSPTMDLTPSNLISDTRATSAKSSSKQITQPAARGSTNSPVVRTAVSLEYAALRHSGHCPLGMYVIPSRTNILVWDAVFFLHRGYYADSVLRFELMFPADYPEHAPIVRFLSDIFHPLISPQTGIFSLAPRFCPWRSKEHHVFHVLHWIKAAFKRSDLDRLQESECPNKDAFKYHENVSSFSALAQQSALLSQSPSVLFDDPSTNNKHQTSLRFQESKPEEVEAMRMQLGLRQWDEPDL